MTCGMICIERQWLGLCIFHYHHYPSLRYHHSIMVQFDFIYSSLPNIRMTSYEGNGVANRRQKTLFGQQLAQAMNKGKHQSSASLAIFECESIHTAWRRTFNTSLPSLSIIVLLSRNYVNGMWKYRLLAIRGDRVSNVYASRGHNQLNCKAQTVHIELNSS